MTNQSDPRCELSTEAMRHKSTSLFTWSLLAIISIPLTFSPGCKFYAKDGECVDAFGVAYDCNDSGGTPDDIDGDGYPTEEDCDDMDPSVNPGATEIPCNDKNDDCNTDTPNKPDEDGDGYNVCATDGDNAKGDDCDDADATVLPGAEELCDLKDNDCEGDIDEGGPWYPDVDGDSFGGTGSTGVDTCDETTLSYADNDDDCDDSDKKTFPGAAPEDSKSKCMTDDDGDNFGSDTPASGVKAGTDCNDSNDNVNTSKGEHEPDPSLCMKDTDQDGWGDSTPSLSVVTPGTDCDDYEENTWPGAYDVCWDGVDNDCDGNDAVDCECPIELNGEWHITASVNDSIVTSDNNACSFITDRYDAWGNYYSEEVINDPENAYGFEPKIYIAGYLSSDTTIALGTWNTGHFVAKSNGDLLFDSSDALANPADPNSEVNLAGGPVVAFYDDVTNVVDIYLYSSLHIKSLYSYTAWLTGRFTDSSTLELQVVDGDLVDGTGDTEFDGHCSSWSQLSSAYEWNYYNDSLTGEANWCRLLSWCCETASGYSGDEWNGSEPCQWECPEGANGSVSVSATGDTYDRGTPAEWMVLPEDKLRAAGSIYEMMQGMAMEEQLAYVSMMTAQIEDTSERAEMRFKMNAVIAKYNANEDFRSEVDALYAKAIETDYQDESLFIRWVRIAIRYELPRRKITSASTNND